jgi:hypothetical protein
MKPQFSSILLLLLLCLPIEAQQPFRVPPYNPDGFNCAVSGRVLDHSNKPVAHSMIVLDDSHQVFFSESDAEGRFLREANCWRPANRRVLFVTSPFNLGGVVPIEPPDYFFAKLGPAFSGQPIVLEKNEVLDVGDVHVQVYYSKVVVRFQNRAGAPLFPKSVDWSLVWLRVRDERGRMIQETNMSINQLENDVRTTESVISMYLPEGRWYLEISPHEDKGPWLKTSVPVIVQRSNNPMEISLRMVTQ